MKNFTAVLFFISFSFAMHAQEVVCPNILNTNPNNSSNQATIRFYDAEYNLLRTCVCTQAGVGSGTQGNFNCGSCMPASWSYASINSAESCYNPVTLPVSMSEFSAVKRTTHNEIFWITLSERDNDYFILEVSTDGLNFRTVEVVNGNGTTSEKQIYTVRDYSPDSVVNYYRLAQVDFDGKTETFPLIGVDNSNNGRTLLQTVNLQGQQVGVDYRGLVIDQFTDGSAEKRMQ